MKKSMFKFDNIMIVAIGLMALSLLLLLFKIVL